VVKSQIWIVISVYILVAIIKNCLDNNSDLYTILQILSLTLLENTLLAVKSHQIIDKLFEEVVLFLVPVSHGLKRWNET